MSNEVVANLLNRQKRMEEVRNGFEGSMQTAFDYVNPRRYDMPGTASKGAKRKTKMYDGVAQDAFWDWVNGMLGWGVSEGLQWQRAAIAAKGLRDSDPVQRFLDEYTEQMDWEFRLGNYYDSLPEQLQDGGSGGTAAMITEESMDLARCVHRVTHPGRYWIAENADGDVDVYHELVTMTAREAAQKYAKSGDTLHPAVKKWSKEAEGGLWQCSFLQCICPADETAIFPRRMTPKKWALATVLYDMTGGGRAGETDQLQDGGSRLVRVEGLDYFSPTVWRFRRNSDETYGYSPAMDVMTVIETAQQHAYNLMNLGDHAANPMKFIPQEKRSEWSFLPGAVNTYAQEKRIAYTMPLGGEYPIAVDRENKIHDLIRKRYGYHVWNVMRIFQEKRERNQATEVLEARADQARLLTGQMNNFWRCAVRPVYDNVAYIAGRAGRMPDPPAELQDKRGKDIITPVFIGPLSQIQIASVKLGGLKQGMGFLGEVAEIVGRHIGQEEAAELYARVNLPDLAEYVCDHSGFPQKLMRSDEETAQVIVSRRRMKAAAEQARNAREMAAAAAQMGKPVDESSLLAAGAA